MNQNTIPVLFGLFAYIALVLLWCECVCFVWLFGLNVFYPQLQGALSEGPAEAPTQPVKLSLSFLV